MGKIQPDERNFQRVIKDRWRGFVTQTHPGLGADAGIPDLLLQTDAAGLVGCELKIGTVDDGDGDGDGVLWSKEIRPAQIRWHNGIGVNGGKSFFLIGVWAGSKWTAYAVDGLSGSRWDTVGWRIGETAKPISLGDLRQSVEKFIEGMA